MRVLPAAEPYQAGVYFLWSGETLTYIGKSRHIQDRVYRAWQRNRYSQRAFFPALIPFDRYTCLVVDCPLGMLNKRLMDLEQAYIATYQPEFNSDAWDVGSFAANKFY